VLYLLLPVLGITAGLRTTTPVAAVSLGAALGWLDLGGTWFAFVGHPATAAILVLLALLELYGDQLPSAGSRKAPGSLVFRMLAGAIASALLGWPSGTWIAGLVLGGAGALIGTWGGFEARRALARAFGRDLPAALIEDAVAIVLALGAVYLA
jgi:uncharacterized membrane protein